MAWLEITIDTAGRDCDAVAAYLTAQGFSDLVIEDQGAFEAFLEENRAYWDYIDESLQERLQGLSRIKLYLQDTQTDELEALRAAAGEQSLPMTVAPLAEEDWNHSWRNSYPPQEVGQSLVVLPYWQADYETRRKKIILDPGLTFGTGAHPSTQMVMEQLETAVIPGCRCLDLGSGSGILSITALRLGAGEAIGVDVDPKAENVARENAAYNGFSAPAFTALTGNVTTHRSLMESLASQPYDLVLVNIVADVIISLAPTLPVFLGTDGLVVCSGILDVRLCEVIAALEAAGLTVTGVRAREDWRCVTAKRSQPADCERSCL